MLRLVAKTGQLWLVTQYTVLVVLVRHSEWGIRT